MNCKLCKKYAKPGPNVMISGDFAVHKNCQPDKKPNPKNKKKIAEYESKKKRKKNPFLAPKVTRGWRDIA